MKLLEKISSFFSGVSLELDHETESQLLDYLLEGIDGLNHINIGDLDKNEIIKWKLREFKKFLKYGDGFEKKMITLDLYKEWEKKIKETLMIGVTKPIMICFGSKDMEINGKNLKKSLRLK